jgi:dipeptidyl-peptidase 4
MTFSSQNNVMTFIVIIFSALIINAQEGPIRWAKEGNQYFSIEKNELVKYTLPESTKITVASKEMLTPQGKEESIKIRNYAFSEDGNLLLIHNNTKKVWRLDTRGDYWVLNLKTKSLVQLGKSLPESSLMFAKFSPDNSKVAYVSNYNLYVENLANSEIKALTTNGNRKQINGTFDWVYEEEFACRDGFQWSPDSKQISFWNSDANQIRDFYMINNTDSIYSQLIPLEYPKIGYAPSPVKIGIIDIETKKTVWLKVPGESNQNYLPRMEWLSKNELFVQQLNRHQNESKIFSCNPTNGEANLVFSEKDKAWIDVYTPWENVYGLTFRHKFNFINKGKEFLWMSEKDGWRHLYRITNDKKGGKEICITKGNYDVMDIRLIDEKNNLVYFLASPKNATQKYLYKTTLDGQGKLEKISPEELEGTHDYSISSEGKYASHNFSNHYTSYLSELIDLSTNAPINEEKSIKSKLAKAQGKKSLEFFKVKTEEGIEMDGWMVKPNNFDYTKKYPVVFYVYTEPWGANVHDTYGAGDNDLYAGDMKEDGYIYMSIDNRGTPAPKGREWRKCIYRKVGVINIRDQAMAAKEIMKMPFVDSSRIAVWGWSGGGSATLNLMFQYPEIYKTGIGIAAVANQLTYDNIYQERYMGLPEESMADIIAGSPITHAKNLKGNLLYIHGTGDDNVHYANAEMLLNELIKHNKQFQFMAYPNRSHSINEGEGTSQHLSTLFTEYLKRNCPPGGR